MTNNFIIFYFNFPGAGPPGLGGGWYENRILDPITIILIYFIICKCSLQLKNYFNWIIYRQRNGQRHHQFQAADRIMASENRRRQNEQRHQRADSFKQFQSIPALRWRLMYTEFSIFLTDLVFMLIWTGFTPWPLAGTKYWMTAQTVPVHPVFLSILN